MKKYIIKNCPAIWEENNICTYTDNLNLNKCYCKDITDCLLKQIADICKAEKDKGFVMSRYGAKVPVSEGWDLACEILELLEIEDVNNE